MAIRASGNKIGPAICMANLKLHLKPFLTTFSSNDKGWGPACAWLAAEDCIARNLDCAGSDATLAAIPPPTRAPFVIALRVAQLAAAPVPFPATLAGAKAALSPADIPALSPGKAPTPPARAPTPAPTTPPTTWAP